MAESGSYQLVLDGKNDLTGDYQFSLISPAADLTVSSVSIPSLAVGNPAEAVVSWSVTNEGEGNTTVESWTDRVVASLDETYGDADDLFLGEFVRTGFLTVGESYSRSETVAFPVDTTDRFHIFVETDVHDDVFEDLDENNNHTKAVTTLDIVPIAYADLVVTSITSPSAALAGREFEVTWLVENQGIGTTDRESWYDEIVLTQNPDGSAPVVSTRTSIERLGSLTENESYEQTATISVPNGIEGDFYVSVEAAEADGPFEYLFGDNNVSVSNAISIALPATPDLEVTNVQAPAVTIADPASISVSWDVNNVGEDAGVIANWTDKVVASENDIFGDEDDIVLARVDHDGLLPVGSGYCTSTTLLLPPTFSRSVSLVLPDGCG